MKWKEMGRLGCREETSSSLASSQMALALTGFAVVATNMGPLATSWEAITLVLAQVRMGVTVKKVNYCVCSIWQKR